MTTTMDPNGRASRLIHSVWGALLALAAAAGVGAAGTLFFTGLMGVPEKVGALEARVAALEVEVAANETAVAEQLAAILRDLGQIACMAIPPTSRAVLEAMSINCDRFDRPARGVPLPQNEPQVAP